MIALCTVTAMRTSVLLCYVLVCEAAFGFLNIIHISFVLLSVNAVQWALIIWGSLKVLTVSYYVLVNDLFSTRKLWLSL